MGFTPHRGRAARLREAPTNFNSPMISVIGGDGSRFFCFSFWRRGILRRKVNAEQSGATSPASRQGRDLTGEMGRYFPAERVEML
jgi:hypothetical protein